MREVSRNKLFKNKPNVRILSSGSIPSPNEKGLSFESIAGGMLVQTKDNYILNRNNLKFVTKKKPSDEEIDNLLFAWKVAKHTKSNSIIL